MLRAINSANSESRSIDGFESHLVQVLITTKAAPGLGRYVKHSPTVIENVRSRTVPYFWMTPKLLRHNRLVQEAAALECFIHS